MNCGGAWGDGGGRCGVGRTGTTSGALGAHPKRTRSAPAPRYTRTQTALHNAQSALHLRYCIVFFVEPPNTKRTRGALHAHPNRVTAHPKCVTQHPAIRHICRANSHSGPPVPTPTRPPTRATADAHTQPFTAQPWRTCVQRRRVACALHLVAMVKILKLALRLLHMFANGKLAATHVQNLAAAAWADGWGHDGDDRDPVAESLAGAGNWGRQAGPK